MGDTFGAEFDYITGRVTIDLRGEVPSEDVSYDLSDGTSLFPLTVSRNGQGEPRLACTLPGSARISDPWFLLARGRDTASISAHPIERREVDYGGRTVPGIALSICIPTYNRAARVTATVERILMSPRRDIEVVVVDNKSPDDTLARLRAIDDPRLSIYENDENYGPFKNFIRAAALGRGEFVMLDSDEDVVDIAALDDFIDFLRSDDELGCGVAPVHGVSMTPTDVVFAAGTESVVAAAKGFTYLGGFFYRHRDLELKSFFKDYDDPSFIYPFENIAWPICTRKKFALYSKPVIIRGSNEVSFIPRHEGRHFNHPVNLILQYLTRVRLLKEHAGAVLSEEKLELCKAKFRSLLFRQSFILAYDCPLDEKFEILASVLRNAKEALGNKEVASTAYHAMAELFRDLSMPSVAEPMAKSASQSDERNVGALFLLGSIFEAAGDTDAVTSTYADIIAKTPRRWSYMFNIFAKFKVLNRPDEMAEVRRILLEEIADTPAFVRAKL